MQFSLTSMGDTYGNLPSIHKRKGLPVSYDFQLISIVKKLLMHCATSEMLGELMGSGGKASQKFCGKVGLVPLFLNLTFVPGNIPLKKLN